jgi:hypothetical protein
VVNQDLVELIDRSRSLADSADQLSAALRSDDRIEVDDAVDDLLDTYDTYALKSSEPETRLRFDELSTAAGAVERDRLTADGLAAALLDLEVALVLQRAGEQSGELAEAGEEGSLDGAVQSLTETVDALDAKAVAGSERFAFDEVSASSPELVRSPDQATAKAAYEEQVQKVYELLFADTASLFGSSVSAVVDLDGSKIADSLGAVTEPLRVTAAGRIATRVLESVKRAVERMKEALGEEGLKTIEGALTEHFDEIRAGRGPTRRALSYLYGYEQGVAEIRRRLETTRADAAKIDQGSEALMDLHQRAVQSYVLLKRISQLIADLTKPVKFILEKIGGTLPVDLIVGGVHLLIMSVALFRGMDYADTSLFWEGVDGVVAISRQTLDVVDV